jgi:hypothetical protein
MATLTARTNIKTGHLVNSGDNKVRMASVDELKMLDALSAAAESHERATLAITEAHRKTFLDLKYDICRQIAANREIYDKTVGNAQMLRRAYQNASYKRLEQDPENLDEHISEMSALDSNLFRDMKIAANVRDQADRDSLALLELMKVEMETQRDQKWKAAYSIYTSAVDVVLKARRNEIHTKRQEPASDRPNLPENKKRAVEPAHSDAETESAAESDTEEETIENQVVQTTLGPYPATATAKDPKSAAKPISRSRRHTSPANSVASIKKTEPKTKKAAAVARCAKNNKRPFDFK